MAEPVAAVHVWAKLKVEKRQRKMLRVLQMLRCRTSPPECTDRCFEKQVRVIRGGNAKLKTKTFENVFEECTDISENYKKFF